MTGLLKGGKFPHAFLFTGIDGIGKKKTALTFAGALNCKKTAEKKNLVDPCGECRPCRKITSGTHPDIIVIAPEKSRIKIATIRDLGRMLAIKPYEALQRVVVIDQAQTMNPEAGNSLLKLLEEPPENTLLILIAGNTQSLLPTIVSRCQQVAFKPIPEQALAEHLEGKGVPHRKAAILAQLANGSYDKADKLVDTDWVSRREWIVRVIDRHDPDGYDHQHTDGSRHPHGDGDRVGKTGSFLAFSEWLSRDKEALADTLDIMTSWFRDLAVVKAGSDRIVNTDLLDQITRSTRHYRTSSLLANITALETAKKSIQANANTRLTLDIMMMNLS